MKQELNDWAIQHDTTFAKIGKDPDLLRQFRDDMINSDNEIIKKFNDGVRAEAELAKKLGDKRWKELKKKNNKLPIKDRKTDEELKKQVFDDVRNDVWSERKRINAQIDDAVRVKDGQILRISKKAKKVVGILIGGAWVMGVHENAQAAYRGYNGEGRFQDGGIVGAGVEVGKEIMMAEDIESLLGGAVRAGGAEVMDLFGSGEELLESRLEQFPGLNVPRGGGE